MPIHGVAKFYNLMWQDLIYPILEDIYIINPLKMIQPANTFLSRGPPYPKEQSFVSKSPCFHRWSCGDRSMNMNMGMEQEWNSTDRRKQNTR
jgi:hypothetical protein